MENKEIQDIQIVKNEKNHKKLEMQLRVHIFTERLNVINKYYPNGVKWICDKCTFINEKLIFECEMCESEKEYK